MKKPSDTDLADLEDFLDRHECRICQLPESPTLNAVRKKRGNKFGTRRAVNWLVERKGYKEEDLPGRGIFQTHFEKCVK
jgi:hypothetical protein